MVYSRSWGERIQELEEERGRSRGKGKKTRTIKKGEGKRSRNHRITHIIKSLLQSMQLQMLDYVGKKGRERNKSENKRKNNKTNILHTE